MSCDVLFCPVLCCPVLCCAVLCCAVLFCAVLCCPHHSLRKPCTVLAKLGSQATTQHGHVFVSVLPAKLQHTMVTERAIALPSYQRLCHRENDRCSVVSKTVRERTIAVPLCQRVCHRENSRCSFESKTVCHRENDRCSVVSKTVSRTVVWFSTRLSQSVSQSRSAVSSNAGIELCREFAVNCAGSSERRNTACLTYSTLH